MGANHRPLVVDMIDAEEEWCTCCTESFHRMPLFSLRTGSISDHDELVQIPIFYAFPPFQPVFFPAVLLTFWHYPGSNCN